MNAGCAGKTVRSLENAHTFVVKVFFEQRACVRLWIQL